ncbi:MAG: hypothetical protein RIC15_12100 [Vicingaceae bacterium]
MSFGGVKRLNSIVLLLVVFLVSCIADDLEKLKKTQWTPELALPLIDSRFDVSRVFSRAFEDGALLSGSDGLITMVYSGELFRLKADEFISFQDFEIDLALAQGELPFINKGMLLKHLDFDKGILEVHIEEALIQDVLVTINMPRSTKNGIPFKETFVMHYKGQSSTIFDTIFFLDGYSFDLTGPGGQQSNQININYEAISVNGGQVVDLDVCRLKFRDLSFLFLDGYLGKLDLGSYNDSLDLTIFENFKSGSIILEDPKINFRVDNSFGFPISLTFNNFSGSGVGGNSNLDGDIIDNGIDVGSPVDTTNSIVTTEEINSGNSNIGNFLSITPNSINFDLNLEANTSNDSTELNFASKNSEVVGFIDLELPLKGRLDSVIFENVLDLDLGEAQNANSAIFKLHAENFFPIGVYMQVYFLNDRQEIIDSLILDGSTIFKEAVTDKAGFSVVPSIEESYFSIISGRFDIIKNLGKYIRIRAMLLTDQSATKSIKIRDNNYLDIKIGAILRFQRDQ